MRFPALAVNADGATVVAWERFAKGSFAIEAREGARPAALARTQRLSPKGYQPLVAVGDDGTKAVMWHEPGARGRNTVRVAIARPGHRFGTPRIVRRQVANLFPIAVAVQPAGRVVAIWSRGRTAAFALARKGHAFGRPQSLGAAIGAACRQRSARRLGHRAAGRLADPVGRRTARRRPHAVADGVELLRAAARDRSRALSPPTSRASVPCSSPDPGGVAAVTTAMTNDSTAILLARRAADGSWTAPQLVATIGFVDAQFVEGLTAALPADGSAVAAWSLVDEDPAGLGGKRDARSFASVAAPSAAFGPAQALTPEGPHKFGFPAAVAAGGEAFVASAEPHGAVVVSARSAGASTLARAGDAHDGRRRRRRARRGRQPRPRGLPAARPPAPRDRALTAAQSRGSTGSDSSASTPKTHSWTRYSGSRRTKRSSASMPRRELAHRQARACGRGRASAGDRGLAGRRRTRGRR